ncbi:MAG: alkaline phosphatase, partial [Bacteroidota bacterium]
MKRILIITGFLISLFCSVSAQEKVRNLIVMIPDGTSSNILSLARWYKFGACPANNCRLAIDLHICGMVSTYNSDSPIGDSAPTGSTYATGHLSNTGFVATYPVSTGKEKDLIEVDPLRAYHPLFTILEAARIQGKSTGLVVTCEFTHATPAGFSAHTPFRDDEEAIAIQMVHNNLSVVFGGGLQYLDPARRKDGLDLFNVLRLRNYRLVTARDEFETLTPVDTLVYCLFSEDYLPNDLDRDPEKVPSLAEMTRKAIKILSENPKGFFLMVEGSKIDWAAHQNDPVGTITEYLAFDDAVKEAMDYANRDGYTAVVIVPDHGTSGISLGNSRSSSNHDVLPIHDLLQPLSNCKKTVEWITGAIQST